MRNRIFYVGYDITSLEILAKDSELQVVGVNLIPEFLNRSSSSLADHCFRLLYRRRFEGKRSWIDSALLGCWRIISDSASSIWKRYADYLEILIRQKISIVDISEESAALEYLKNSVDLVVVNNWWLLSAAFINSSAFGVVNVHPSRLPQYRGSVPTLWSLKNRDPSSAVSYMLINAGVDTGLILSQHEFNIDSEDDSLSIERKVEAILRATLAADLKSWLSGRRKPTQQDESLASLTPRFAAYMQIDWAAESAREISNKVNLYPYLWPLDLCHATVNGQKVRFQSARMSELPSLGPESPAGTVRLAGKKWLFQTNDGVVELLPQETIQ